ncbi:hypothetical protein CLCR_03129 [Cladophialophora carrionii]|uniref:Uncharacterized protein n=1 Tax=Cladophialophora carrionii TaxID=86049 RepID=A0A1C1D208_9EURO|nr:hypothetical protein CLCR_03129 [Cladophialophora carrionii]
MAPLKRFESPIFGGSDDKVSHADSVPHYNSVVDLEFGMEELTRPLPEYSLARPFPPPRESQVDGAIGTPHVEMRDLSAHGHHTEDTIQRRKDVPQRKRWRALLLLVGWLLLVLASVACVARISILVRRRELVDTIEATFWFLVQFACLFFPLARLVVRGVAVAGPKASRGRRFYAQTVALLSLATAIGLPLGFL